MVFVGIKALSLLPLLPVAVPLGVVYTFFSAINSAHTLFMVLAHGWKLAYWGPKFMFLITSIPFIPSMWLTTVPMSVAKRLACDLLFGVLTFFIYPLAYLLWTLHALHQTHIHLWAVLNGTLKLLNS